MVAFSSLHRYRFEYVLNFLMALSLLLQSNCRANAFCDAKVLENRLGFEARIRD